MEDILVYNSRTDVNVVVEAAQLLGAMQAYYDG